jgi:hypothetical protein
VANGPGHPGHDDGGPVHVAVDRARTIVAPREVVVHRLADLEDRVQWNLAPSRLRIEEAVLDVAAEAADDFAAVAVIAGAVQSRRTTAARLDRALSGRTRIARRDLLVGVLADVATGACSALEHAYLTRVERPHGLPWARRQARASSRGPVYRDVLYQDAGVVVELDGRWDHTRARDRDRDLTAISMRRWTDSSRSGWAGGRPSVVRASPPPRSPRCSRTGGGRAARERADSAMVWTSSHQVTRESTLSA